MTIVIKVLKDGKPQSGKEVHISSVGVGGQKSRSTGADGCVSFAMDAGDYNVRIAGKPMGAQYLGRQESVFHI